MNGSVLWLVDDEISMRAKGVMDVIKGENLITGVL